VLVSALRAALLIASYLADHAEMIFKLIDADITRQRDDPRAAIFAVFEAVENDIARSGFRGCAFNNASIEFVDPGNGARTIAREYRQGLRDRLVTLATALRGKVECERLGEEIALVIEGMYLSAAHLGSTGPARRGRGLVERLLGEGNDAR
jgi:hypothetical protein